MLERLLYAAVYSRNLSELTTKHADLADEDEHAWPCENDSRYESLVSLHVLTDWRNSGPRYPVLCRGADTRATAGYQSMYGL
jgi:hypothetical protein